MDQIWLRAGPVTADVRLSALTLRIVLVLSRLRRYSYLIRPGDAVVPPFSWMIRNSGAWSSPLPGHSE